MLRILSYKWVRGREEKIFRRTIIIIWNKWELSKINKLGKYSLVCLSIVWRIYLKRKNCSSCSSWL